MRTRPVDPARAKWWFRTTREMVREGTDPQVAIRAVREKNRRPSSGHQMALPFVLTVQSSAEPKPVAIRIRHRPYHAPARVVSTVSIASRALVDPYMKGELARGEWD